MGRVYYARQKDLERDVAIKVIKATHYVVGSSA